MLLSVFSVLSGSAPRHGAKKSCAFSTTMANIPMLTFLSRQDKGSRNLRRGIVLTQHFFILAVYLPRPNREHELRNVLSKIYNYCTPSGCYKLIVSIFGYMGDKSEPKTRQSMTSYPSRFPRLSGSSPFIHKRIGYLYLSRDIQTCSLRQNINNV